MWFEELVGFAETTGEEVRERLVVDGEILTSKVNGRSFRCGRLEVPSLGELRGQAKRPEMDRPNTLEEVVADVGALHRDPANAGALFQVASQFNLLEMVSPTVTPEHGVGIYEHDQTQGPACAVACGAGTIFRNWFAPVGKATRTQIGQTADCQIDCLTDLGAALVNNDGRLWSVQNGYCMATADGLKEIERLFTDGAEHDRLLGLIRIGLQLDTEVTTTVSGHLVSQAYCSAMPVGYSPIDSEAWEPFARLVLEAAYEATLLAAAENDSRTGNRRVFLTLLGGGVFGNRTIWITDAIRRAMACHPGLGLDLAIVSYGSSNPAVEHLVDSFN